MECFFREVREIREFREDFVKAKLLNLPKFLKLSINHSSTPNYSLLLPTTPSIDTI